MEAREYDTIKAALFERMGITAENQQKCWWEATIKPNKTATQWTARLWDLTSYCVTDFTTPMEAGEKFSTEHAQQCSGVGVETETSDSKTSWQANRSVPQPQP